MSNPRSKYYEQEFSVNRRDAVQLEAEQLLGVPTPTSQLPELAYSPAYVGFKCNWMPSHLPISASKTSDVFHILKKKEATPGYKKAIVAAELISKLIGDYHYISVLDAQEGADDFFDWRYFQPENNPRLASDVEEQVRLSEVIALRRSLKEAKDEIERLRREKDTPEFQSKCTEDVLLHKTHHGLVTGVLGTQAEITYDISAAPVKQVYRFSDFQGGKEIKIGDGIEACVVLRKTVYLHDDSIDKEFTKLDDFQSGHAAGKIKF